MAMKTGICKLCLQEKPLQNKSHIIPDFMYREGKIYHADHTVQSINLKKTPFTSFTRVKKQYNAEYEGGILCRNCDGVVIKAYEDYARKLLYGGNLKPVPEYKYQRGTVTISEISYTHMKLFFLSILWRAAISSRPFFKEIQISPDQEEELRKMILSGTAGANSVFPIVFAWDFGKDHKLKQYLGQPVSLNNSESHLFVFPSFFVNIFANIKLVPKQFKNFRIFDNGVMRCFLAPQEQVWRLLTNLYS